MLETPKAFRDSPVINPLLIDEKIIADLPPSHIMVCGDDPLRDHGMLFKKKLDLMRLVKGLFHQAFGKTLLMLT